MPLRPLAIGIALVALALALWLLIAAVRRHRWTSLFQVVPALGLLALVAVLVPYIFGLNAPHPFFNRPATVPAGTVVYYRYGPNRSDNHLTLYAVDGQTGKTLWQRTVLGFDTTVASVGSVIYAASFQPDEIHVVQVLAFDGATGSILWQRTIPGSYVPTASLLAGDTLFLGVVETATPPVQHVIALRPSDGAQLWNLQVATTFPSPPQLLAGHDILYVEPSGAGEQARRLTDGKLLWTNNSVQRLLAAGPDAVYDLSPVGSVTAYNAQTGAQLWQYGNNVIFDAIGVLSGGTLYVTARHNGPIADASGKLINPETLYVLDAASGQLRWTFATHSSSYGTLATGPGIVYIAADDGIHALRASDGVLLWHSNAQTGRSFAPIAPSVGSTLYLTSSQTLPPERFALLAPQRSQTYLYAVNAADGSDDWGVAVGPVLSFGGFAD